MHSVDATTEQMIRSVLAYAENRLRLNPVPLDKGSRDPAELDFDYSDASSFEDLESGEQIPVVPQSLAEEYRALIRAHVETLTTRFAEHRIDYTLLNTSEPLDRALFSYLSSRERLMRVR